MKRGQIAIELALISIALAVLSILAISRLSRIHTIELNVEPPPKFLLCGPVFSIQLPYTPQNGIDVWIYANTQYGFMIVGYNYATQRFTSFNLPDVYKEVVVEIDYPDGSTEMQIVKNSCT